MNISGVVVHAKPDVLERVRAKITELAGVEVHAVDKDGKMVVTIEKESDQDVADTFETLVKLDGVLSTSMIYHHFEAESNLEEEA